MTLLETRLAMSGNIYKACEVFGSETIYCVASTRLSGQCRVVSSRPVAIVPHNSGDLEFGRICIQFLNASVRDEDRVDCADEVILALTGYSTMQALRSCLQFCLAFVLEGESCIRLGTHRQIRQGRQTFFQHTVERDLQFPLPVDPIDIGRALKSVLSPRPGLSQMGYDMDMT